MVVIRNVFKTWCGVGQEYLADVANQPVILLVPHFVALDVGFPPVNAAE